MACISMSDAMMQCFSFTALRVVWALEDRVLRHARESLVRCCCCWHIAGTVFGLFGSTWSLSRPTDFSMIISSPVYVHVFFASGHWFSQSLVVKAKTGVHHFHGDNNELGTACGRYYRPSAPNKSGSSGSTKNDTLHLVHLGWKLWYMFLYQSIS